MRRLPPRGLCGGTHDRVGAYFFPAGAGSQSTRLRNPPRRSFVSRKSAALYFAGGLLELARRCVCSYLLHTVPVNVPAVIHALFSLLTGRQQCTHGTHSCVWALLYRAAVCSVCALLSVCFSTTLMTTVNHCTLLIISLSAVSLE